jgi:hypothetical protein
VTLAGTAGSRTHRSIPHLTLNSDGRKHPLENVLAVSVLGIGLASFVIGLVVRNDSGAGSVLSLVATATGLYGVFVGLYAQLMSATREERVLIVTGIIAGFIGLAIGLAHGALA